MGIQLYGIRHHGPGSARALLAALRGDQPDQPKADLLLIEGPPESEPLLDTLRDPLIKPPVAILHYVERNPALHLYSPFAIFSPEWQAIRFAQENDIPIRMFDLPLRHQLALLDRSELSTAAPSAEHDADPLTKLAALAGFADPELWWEMLIEHRPSDRPVLEDREVFAALREAMHALRAAAVDPPSRLELLREAWMRRELRLATGACEGQRIAVVCGAWHLPALDPDDPTLPNELPNELADEALLTGLPAVDVRSVWVPWSDRQFSRQTGYAAGISAPGWSTHLWNNPGHDQAIRWLSQAAATLRDHGLDISPAQVIDATRLAESLAALRGLCRPGLAESNEAMTAIFCAGDARHLRPVQEEMVIGNGVGTLPDDSPAPPLLLDWQRQCRTLRLKPDASAVNLDLDLRRPLDLRRSRLLHQLALLDVGWGTLSTPHQTGTFRETWRLVWKPEVARRLKLAGGSGLTVEMAALTRIHEILDQYLSDSPPSSSRTLTSLLQTFAVILRAGLGNRLLDAPGPALTRRLAILLDRLAAEENDLETLLDSFPGLVSLEEYGSLQVQFDSPIDLQIITTLVDRSINRISIALTRYTRPGALTHSPKMLELLLTVDQAMALAGRHHRTNIWSVTLRDLVHSASTPPGLAGRAALLLWQSANITPAELQMAIRRATSTALPPLAGAAWIDAFFSRAGILLVQDQQLRQIVDDWLGGLDEPEFIAVLPLLRRTFSTFTPAERRTLDHQIRRQTHPHNLPLHSRPSPGLDQKRASLMIPTLRNLLGLDVPAADNERGVQ